MSDGAAADHRTLPRRRGQELESAILAAAFADLDEVGYPSMTMEGVALRAAASKASLYRRWPGRLELALDAVRHGVPDLRVPVDTGTLRGDLLALVRAVAERADGPAGEVLRAVAGEALAGRESIAALRDLSRDSVVVAVTDIVRRAAARGEVTASPAPRRLQVAQAMLRDQVLLGERPVPDAVLVEMVDDVLVPLYTAP